MKSVAEILRELREDQDIKQSEVSAALNLVQQTYSNYETGVRELPIRHVVKLAKFFNVSTDYLLGVTDNKLRYASFNDVYFSNVTLEQIIAEMNTLNPRYREELYRYLKMLRLTQKYGLDKI